MPKATKEPKKTIPSASVEGVKKRAKRKAESYASYITKLLKDEKTHITNEKNNEAITGMRIHRPALDSLCSLTNDLFEKIAYEASILARINKRFTIGKKEIESAVKLVIPNDLGNNAITEAERNLKKFKESTNVAN